MRKWVADQLTADGEKAVVVIDPERAVSADELGTAFGNASVHTVDDWFELRRVWELHGRRRDSSEPRLVIVTRDPKHGSTAELPFDIEQHAVAKPVRIPGPQDLRTALAKLDDDASDIAVERMAAGILAPVDALVTASVGLPSQPIVGEPTREFQAALRLFSHIQADEVVRIAAGAFGDSLALALLNDPPRLDEVQRAWADWLADPVGSGWAPHMHECRAELIDLFMAGQLEPVPDHDANAPLWATVGVAQPSPAARVSALLANSPAEPTSFDDWVRNAQWWGEVRSGLAQVNPADADLDAQAWSWWHESDELFLTWLRTQYGSQLTRSWGQWPVSLDKVQPFLAKRQTVVGKLLLVVLDGMGFTQWTRIRELSSVPVARSGGVLAMLPTLTEVSRQAIAAGGLPIDFADSLRSTHKEPQRWAAAWSESGVSSRWLRIDGAHTDELAAVPFGESEVIGLVLSATDELMHSAELLGDVGLHASLEAWVRSGVLRALLDEAASNGYETWLTADHGNLAVSPSKEPREGAFVERAGTRARRYASKTLRDSGAVEGVAWDHLPGYPDDEAERLLFAPGRVGWGSSRLSHGGLSLDEVMVPLVQIESRP